MDHQKLNAEPRSVTGKAVARLRRDGLVPVVVYGGTLEGALSLQINERELDRVLNRAGTSTVIDLDVAGGQRYPVLTREVQRHPLRHNITHVDFLAVRLDRVIQAEVALVLTGEPEIVANNEALLMHILDAVTVEALPDRLPNRIEVDVSGLSEIGQQITVADLSVAEGVRIMTDSEALIATLAAPKMAVIEEEVEGLEEGDVEAEEAEDVSEADEESAEMGEEE